ncbi:hypothetical protein CONPUDRAFT_116043 [Coniophora puteana RWD-64-598 SS2]|uniref:Conserved oligomeric Golgi complex subunit 1 n=1 Tax=Coniophora puteana (strain RWD-64-598) TaxID=741705 RepID=A0A5M3N6U7_CONPW|nr:uncharacterized protein CONPUDRAFT_116043 [Coniophora puteana RWD-64-598 SS2]EIW87036.1 hypothetical protein CONPUDRAFT_116043 [Coniophora puteana RWD-64-598 SS2]
MARQTPVTSPASSTAPSQSLLSPASVFKLVPTTPLQTTAPPRPGALPADPDELFTRYTIAEVKTRQLQLRADAEAKQEELRVMVGERYRDLLQASTSIVLLSKSAQRVHDALEEIKGAISSHEHMKLPTHAADASKGDNHLDTLQALSAHVKLLLDAPEHLWRLIEREKFFQAAWLFLLARVVHQALVQDDDQDDDSWINRGIDVMEQFPIVQRQWETISHFRTQIIHKATLSLRSFEKSTEDTCATMLTLHILDARPLTETLTMYFTQRTRMLNTFLNKSADIPHLEVSGSASGLAPQRAAENRASLQRALEIISRTVVTAREIFSSPAEGDRPLAVRALEHIQAESPSTEDDFPSELLLDTLSLLSTLPSSSYLQILPPSIKSYKPYVDLESQSSTVSPAAVAEALDRWFQQSTASLQTAFQKWLSGLETVTQVWNLRTFIHKWLGDSSHLTAEDRDVLGDAIDEAVSGRILAIWKAILVKSGQAFTDKLVVVVPTSEIQHSLVAQLYHPPAVPSLPPPGSGPAVFIGPFHKYSSALSHQLDGRTEILDSVLESLEAPAEAIWQDLRRIELADQEKKLAKQLRQQYRVAADELCSEILSTLKDLTEKVVDASGTVSNTESQKLLSRLLLELSTTSSFIYNVEPDESMSKAFKASTLELFNHVISCWKERIIGALASNYLTQSPLSQTRDAETTLSPTEVLMNCLHTLSTSLFSLGLAQSPMRLDVVALGSLVSFCASISKGNELPQNSYSAPAIFDLAMLHTILLTWQGQDCADQRLDEAISSLDARLASLAKSSIFSEREMKAAARNLLMRTQMVLPALLPSPSTVVLKDSSSDKASDKSLAALLPYGVPATDTQFHPVFSVAKPSSRFTLLNVEQ